MEMALPGAVPSHQIDDSLDMMDLQRALMRGTGYFDWMMRPSADLAEKMAATSLEPNSLPTLRPLPVVNFLEIADAKYVDALVEEALPQDRTRFRQYLSKRLLGLGIITAVSLISSALSPIIISIMANSYLRAQVLARQLRSLWQLWLCKAHLVESSALPRPMLLSTTSPRVSTASPLP